MNGGVTEVSGTLPQFGGKPRREIDSSMGGILENLSEGSKECFNLYQIHTKGYHTNIM